MKLSKRLEDLLAAGAFAEEGEFQTARKLAEPHEPPRRNRRRGRGIRIRVSLPGAPVARMADKA